MTLTRRERQQRWRLQQLHLVEHLQEVVAATLAVQNANCASKGRLWGRAEADHAAATTLDEAEAAARPAIELCQGCPAIEACRTWAQQDRYTGLAAGQAWIDGIPHAARTTRYQPMAS